MKNVIALFSGIIFSIGLGISGMVQPGIVKGFLDIFGSWNWNLLGVMIGAIGVHGLAYIFIKKRTAPILETKFNLPTKKDLDWKLITGALLFGIGWGWGGICPGPGIVSLTSGNLSFFYFVAAMLIGMKLFQFVDKKFISK